MSLKSEEQFVNYNFLKLFSMFLIVIYHTFRHSGVYWNATGFYYNLFNFLLMAIVIHVNLFVLITGYFKSTSFKQNFKKVLYLNNITWFYRVLGFFIGVFVLKIEIPGNQIIDYLFPISLGQYWFINVYLVLYLISPYLNIVAHNLTQDLYKNLLKALFILFSLIPFLTYQQGINNLRGFSITHFIFLYFLGAYIRKFKILKEFSKKEKQKKLIFIFILCLLFYFFSNLFFSSLHVNDSLIIRYFSKVFNVGLMAYDNPFTIIQSVVFFILVGTTNFKRFKINKLINAFSPYVLGVYLVHRHEIIKPYLYSWFGINPTKAMSLKYILYIVFVGIIIFFISLIVGIIIQQLINFFNFSKKSAYELKD